MFKHMSHCDLFVIKTVLISCTGKEIFDLIYVVMIMSLALGKEHKLNELANESAGRYLNPKGKW
jgi:hypothetical protein